jgi:hypothetical protein
MIVFFLSLSDFHFFISILLKQRNLQSGQAVTNLGVLIRIHINNMLVLIHVVHIGM